MIEAPALNNCGSGRSRNVMNARQKMSSGAVTSDAASGWRGIHMRSHCRIDVIAAERVQAEGRARDVEVEGEVLVHRNHVAQMALDRIARIKPLRAIAGPQHLHRLTRLVH